MMIDIKNIEGSVIISVEADENAVFHEELMQSDYINISWQSDENITLPAGTYVDYGLEKYRLLEPYTPTKQDECTYQYTPQFQSRIMNWDKQITPVYTYEEDGTTVKSRDMDWQFTGSPADAMYIVKQAIKNETVEEWTVQVSDSLPSTITISSQSASIFSVLNSIASECNTEWWGDKGTNTLYLSKCIYGEPITLQVGDNVQIPSVTSGNEGYYTRFYAFGSTRNISQGTAQNGAVVNNRLTLDPAKYPGGYKDIREGLKPEEIFVKTLYFDSIYPSSKLTISDVRARLRYRLDNAGNKIKIGGTEEEPVYEQYAIWYFQIAEFTFDPSTIIENKNLSASFESGQLAGRDFELTYHENAETVSDVNDVTPFEVKAGDYEIIIDETSGQIIPGVAYIIPQEGDIVILYNIEMPAEYTASAQTELETELDKEIAKYAEDNNTYQMSSDPTRFYAQGTDLQMGQAVTFVNDENSLSSRVQMVEKRLDYSCYQVIKVGNKIIKGNTQQLKEEVASVNQNIDVIKSFNELSASLSQAYANAQREMIEGFARISNMWKFDSERKDTIYSEFNVYTLKELSAGGYSDEGGTEPGGGTGIDETKLWQILGNSGTEQIAKNHLTTALSDYITASSANSLFATKTELSNYAASSDLAQTNTNVTAISTKLDDFLEGSDTDTIINKWKELEAFLSGMSESDNLADILAIKADTTWVTEQLSTKLDKTVFDDLFEKVLISDGKYAIRAKYDFYSEGEISAGGYSDEGGGTGVGSLLGIKVNGSTYEPVDGYITIPDYPTELAWGAITGKPTTLEGYGITDAVVIKDGDPGNTTDPGANYPAVGFWSNVGSYFSMVRRGWGGQLNISGGELSVRGCNNSVFGDWTKVITEGNYTSTLDTRYVKKSGDTMTGALNIMLLSLANNNEINSSDRLYLGYRDTPQGVNVCYNNLPFTYGSGNYTIWHAGNGGSGSGLDADLLDGVHNGDLVALTIRGVYTGAGGMQPPSYFKDKGISVNMMNIPIQYSDVVYINGYNNSGYDVPYINAIAFQKANMEHTNVYHASAMWNGSSWNIWHTFIDSYNIKDYNAGSATKLQTPRTIWGQSFDGTNNVSGELSGCTRVMNASSQSIYLGNSDNSGWVYTQDIASHQGTGYWAINYAGSSWFKKVNIGYTYPNEGSFPLNVQGTISSTSLSTQNIRIECDNNGVLEGRGSEINNYNSSLYLQHNSSTYLVCCVGGGNMGVGTLSPAYKLHVEGNAYIRDRTTSYEFYANGAVYSNNWFRSNGDTGWFSETYRGGIYMTDTTYVRIYNSKSFWCDANIVAVGEISAGSSSDARLKNILEKQDYTKRLLSLGMVVDYEYNELAFTRNVRSIERRRYTGLIYQDVKKVLPQMAGEDEDGYGYLNYIHTDYINLIAGALQQTILKQETIEQRVERLEKENAELKQKIAKLAA